MPSDVPSVLPPNATVLERALEEGMAAPIASYEVPVSALWDPARCPVALLPHLAWALSVDEWDDAWSEQTKRDVCAASFDVHRAKGTRGAVEAACRAAFEEAVLQEWPEYGGEPFTIRVEVSGVVDRTGYELLLRLIDHTKPIFVHLDRVTIINALTLRPRVGVAGRAIAHQVQPWRARPGEAALPQVHLAAAGRAIAHQVQLYRPRPLTAEAAGGAATAVLITQTISAEAT